MPLFNYTVSFPNDDHETITEGTIEAQDNDDAMEKVCREFEDAMTIVGVIFTVWPADS